MKSGKGRQTVNLMQVKSALLANAREASIENLIGRMRQVFKLRCTESGSGRCLETRSWWRAGDVRLTIEGLGIAETCEPTM